jgi:hypothetical protein
MLLTMKDQQRIELVQALMDARLSVAQAAQVLGRSERQVWRLLACARADGLAGLVWRDPSAESKTNHSNSTKIAGDPCKTFARRRDGRELATLGRARRAARIVPRGHD